MKYLLLFAFLIILKTVAAQWTQLNSGTTTDLNAVHFSDAQIGWISGDDGKILHTSNGGTSWTAQISGTTKDLLSIYFTDASHGWSCGKDGVIKHSTDAGTTWTAQTSGTIFDLNSIHFFDNQNGFAVGETGVILKTVNGGSNWTISVAGNGGSGSGSEESDLELTAVQMVSATEAYVCGTDGYFAKTTNAGTSWIVQSSGVTEDFESLHFTSSANGYVAYEAGKVKRTNGNGTFISVYAATSKDLHGIWFINELRGWVAGDEGRLLFTPDGGMNWTSHNILSVEEDLYDIHFPTGNIGYAVGKEGTILKLSNGDQVGIKENESEVEATLSPNPVANSALLTFGNAREKAILITDVNGKQKGSFATASESYTIESEEWNSGIYYVTVISAEGSTTIKLIKL